MGHRGPCPHMRLGARLEVCPTGVQSPAERTLGYRTCVVGSVDNIAEGVLETYCLRCYMTLFLILQVVS